MLQFGWATACLRRDGAHLLEGSLAERAAARRQDDPFDRLGAVEIEALPDRIVLAVDRQQGGAATGDLLHDEPAGADQHLLVGEGDDGPAPDRGQGRRQPGGADDARHHPFGRPQRRLDQRCRRRRPSRSRFRRAPPSAPGNGQGRRSRRIAPATHAPARPDEPGCGSRSAPRPRSRPDCATADRPCFGRPSRSSRESSLVASRRCA